MTETIKIKGICARDVDNIMNKLKLRGLSPVVLDSYLYEKETIVVNNFLDPFNLDVNGTMKEIRNILYSSDYSFRQFFDESEGKYIYECNKKYDTLYVSTDTEVLRQTYEGWYKGKYHGGYKNRHGDMYKVNAIYNGIERATGKFKTIVKWSDGTKTIVTSQSDNHLYQTLAFAYAWVKKQYGSNSAFKRHVDKYVENWGYMGQIFFNDGDYQAQLSVRTKSHDIYDQVALVMTMKDFGGIDKVADILEEKTFNE